ncbi:MAG: RbsD/FucU domain-containing protein [Terriglobales bacterium]
MLRQGILNPNINSLLSRVRHTNTLVIADRGFPRVLDVLRAVQEQCNFGTAFMAGEFRSANLPATEQEFRIALRQVPLTFEPHVDFKKRVPSAIGLIRTGDTIQYANIILESA